jgi:phage terminase Nu1 subunit (DNA packaging protein)
MTTAQPIRLAPPTRAFLTRRRVAELLGVTVHCVEKWAERSTGPKFYTRHQRYRQARTAYRIEDVEEFLRQRANDKASRVSASEINARLVDVIQQAGLLHDEESRS